MLLVLVGGGVRVAECHWNELISPIFISDLFYYDYDQLLRLDAHNNFPVTAYTDIEAECQDDYMKIRVGFNGSFTGLLYSAGNY